MRPFPRHLTSWKPWYYRALIPALRRLGPERCDGALDRLGRLAALGPGRSKRINVRLGIAGEAIGAGWTIDEARSALAGNLARFSARDCTLEGLADAAALARFDVIGAEHLDRALGPGPGPGPILLGSHFGGYLAAMHWLVRRRVPMRLLVQRPRHVSDELSRWFDLAGTADDPIGPARFPQHSLFLNRKMPPGEGVLRVLRARSALADGLAISINGDVAWDAGCSLPGSLLGRRARFQAAWADLAILTRAPVLPIFCSHRPGGRFALRIDPPWRLRPGDQQGAVDRFLGLLEDAIIAEPAEAIAHLLWPDTFPARPRKPAPLPDAGHTLADVCA